jgi:hypothetical protein
MPQYPLSPAVRRTDFSAHRALCLLNTGIIDRIPARGIGVHASTRARGSVVG